MGDLIRKLDESFTVVLATPSHATLTRAVATATIVDDDRPPMGSKSDFNADGQPDVVWQHDSTGQVLVWLMQGTTLTSASAPTPAYGTAGHLVVGTADFYHDGAADIAWQNPTTGDVSIWIMSGLTRQWTAAVVPSIGDPAWRVKAVADINMDTHPDLVWQHQTQGWLVVSMLSGTTTVAQHALSASALTAGWQVVGSGDLDQDGFTALVLQHDTNGDLSWFKLDGSAQVSGASLSPASMPNTQWKICGTLDLDADGQTDLLWQNVVTGELAVWFMNGPALRSSTVPTPALVSGLLWRIVGPR